MIFFCASSHSFPLTFPRFFFFSPVIHIDFKMIFHLLCEVKTMISKREKKKKKAEKKI